MNVSKLLTNLTVGKQKKDWKLISDLGTSAKTFPNLATSGYSEVFVEIIYGGVHDCRLIPISALSISASVFVFGIWAGTQYRVSLSLTAMNMKTQPLSYSASMRLYAR